MRNSDYLLVLTIASLLAGCGSDDSVEPTAADVGMDTTMQEERDVSSPQDASREDLQSECSANEFRDSTGACIACPGAELSCDAVGEVQIDVPTNTVTVTVDDTLEVETARLSGSQSENTGTASQTSAISADGTITTYNNLAFVLEPDAASDTIQLMRLTVTDVCGQESDTLIRGSWAVGGTGTAPGTCVSGPPK